MIHARAEAARNTNSAADGRHSTAPIHMRAYVNIERGEKHG